MATLTVFADTSDGRVQSQDASYSTARSGSSLTTDTAFASNFAGFWRLAAGDYYIREYFLAFDTSSLGSGADVSAATLSLWDDNLLSNTDGWTEIRARLFDWGASLDTGDWRATNGASSGDTLLATIARTAIASSQYNDLSSESAFASNVNKTGDTRLYTLLSEAESATAPTGDNWWEVSSADESGTTQDPKLVVTYTAISISSVTPSEFADGDTGVTIAGSGYGASQGTGKVELGDSSDYATATLVTQTIESWSDTSIDFTVDAGALSPGTVYAFVTNDAGNTTAGFAVTLQKSASGTAAIAVIADPSATGTKQASGSAALATVAATNATGSKQGDGAASLAAIAATAATGSKQTSGAAHLAVIAATAASGSGSEAVAGTAAITVIAALAASGAKHETGAAAIVVTVSLSALGSSPGEALLLYRGQQGQGFDHPQGRGLPTGKATI